MGMERKKNVLVKKSVLAELNEMKKFIKANKNWLNKELIKEYNDTIKLFEKNFRKGQYYFCEVRRKNDIVYKFFED